VPSGNIASPATYPVAGPPYASAVNDNGWLIPAAQIPDNGRLTIQANLYYNCAGDYVTCAGGMMGAAVFSADINGPPKCLVPTSKSSDTCAAVYQASSKTFGSSSNSYALSGTSQDSAGSDTIQVQATGFKISGKGTPLFSYSVYDSTTKDALYPPTDFSSAQSYDFASLPVGSYFFGVTVSQKRGAQRGDSASCMLLGAITRRHAATVIQLCTAPDTSFAVFLPNLSQVQDTIGATLQVNSTTIVTISAATIADSTAFDTLINATTTAMDACAEDDFDCKNDLTFKLLSLFDQQDPATSGRRRLFATGGFTSTSKMTGVALNKASAQMSQTKAANGKGTGSKMAKLTGKGGK
jgi:hypothetical protein